MGSAPSSNYYFFLDEIWCQISLFFLEKRGEIVFPFTLFKKWKWNRNDWKSISRSEREIKMTRDREVKFKKKISRIETLAGQCIVKPKSICSGFVGSAREGQHCIFTSRKLEPDCLMPEFYLKLSYLFNMDVSV